MGHIHSGVLPSHEKRETEPFAAMWMDPETVIVSEVSQEELDKPPMIALTY